MILKFFNNSLASNVLLLVPVRISVIFYLYWFFLYLFILEEKTTVTFSVSRSTLQVGDENGSIIDKKSISKEHILMFTDMISSEGTYNLKFTNGVEEILQTQVEVLGETIILERSYLF